MEKTTNKTQQLKKGQKVAFWATFFTLLLAILKGVAGILYNSKMLLADALHSGADSVAIFVSGLGLWIAAHKKSEKFPYGLYKVETLGTLFIGVFILWAGVELFLDGYHKLFDHPKIIEFPTIPLFVTIISIITAYFIAHYEKKVGKQINSQSLIANAQESFLDIISSIVVLLGILLTYWRIPYVEGIIIMLISLLIFKLSFENIYNPLLILLDANLDEELQKEIKLLIETVPGVKEIHIVKIRQAGPFKFVEIEFSTNPSISLYHAHSIADEVEKRIMEKYSSVESVFIHVEPSKQKMIRAILPVKNIDGLNSIVHNHFGRAPYFVFVKISDNKTIEIEDFYFNEFLDKKQHIGLHVVKVIVNYDLDILFTSQIGEISFYMLKENCIDVYQILEENVSVQQVIEMYRQNKLPRLTAPTHPADKSMVVKENKND
ncbi:MAG: cation diffusion facilitator family transporter [Desulfonauticus sp.]|nr:cation diffusion facilitator family transporter [Desulfonauticus sp.]